MEALWRRGHVADAAFLSAGQARAASPVSKRRSREYSNPAAHMPSTSTLTPSQLVHRIQQSELVDRETLAKTLASFESPISDSGELCHRLVQAGLLTQWQCQRLLEGRRKFLLGKYRLLDQLGRGGMGRVYLAEHTVMHRRVAIKILAPQHAADPEYLGRFFVEARAVAALDDPHVVRAYDVDHVENYHFLVMEYLEGRDVYDIVSQDGPLPSRLAAEYIRQAADGLAHAHKAGLIHRDVKPGNLFVDKQGRLKVLDLGLAYFTTETRAKLPETDEEMIVGTVDFIAPEQALGRTVDERTDIYSLGATLYFMLTGSTPFPDGPASEKLRRHIRSQPTPITDLRPQVSLRVDAICRRMMAKSPADRYASMEEVRDVFTAWLEGKSINSAGQVVDHSDLAVEELTLPAVEDEQPPVVAPTRPQTKPASSTKTAVSRDTSRLPTPPPKKRNQDLSGQVQLPTSAQSPTDVDQLLSCDLKSLDRSTLSGKKISRPQPTAAPPPAAPAAPSLFAKPLTWILLGAVLLGAVGIIAAIIMLG